MICLECTLDARSVCIINQLRCCKQQMYIPNCRTLANCRCSINSLGLSSNNMTDRVQLLMMPTGIPNLINVANVFRPIRPVRLSNSSFALFDMPQLTWPESGAKNKRVCNMLAVAHGTATSWPELLPVSSLAPLHMKFEASFWQFISICCVKGRAQRANVLPMMALITTHEP